MTTLSLSIQTRQPKWELIGFCFATEKNKYLFADPLGLPLNNYSHVRDRLSFADLVVTEIKQAPLQNFDSNLCGRYCIFIAHYVFGANFPIIPCIGEQGLLRFIKHFF